MEFLQDLSYAEITQITHSRHTTNTCTDAHVFPVAQTRLPRPHVQPAAFSHLGCRDSPHPAGAAGFTRAAQGRALGFKLPCKGQRFGRCSAFFSTPSHGPAPQQPAQGEPGRSLLTRPASSALRPSRGGCREMLPPCGWRGGASCVIPRESESPGPPGPPSGSCVRGIFQAVTLEWVASPRSRRPS